MRTWKKLVEPKVIIGDRTSLLETTWILKTSAMERLSSETYHKPIRRASGETRITSGPSGIGER